MQPTYVNEAMKTISARLPHDDVELFQLICEEYQLTQSEAIRCLIQAFIRQIFDAEDQQLDSGSTGRQKTLVHDFEHFQKQQEINQFYESFQKISREKREKPQLLINMS